LFSNLNSEIYCLNKDLTITDYIKRRRNGSHHKNGRRIPKKKMNRKFHNTRSVEKPRKIWKTSYRGEHYKKTSWG